MGVTPNVDRDRALPLALALLAIVSLALAAATLDSAVVTDGAAGLGDDDDGFGHEQRPSRDPMLGPASGDDTAAGGPITLSTCTDVVRQPPVLAGLGLLFLGLFAAVYRSTRSAFAGLVVCGGVSLPVGLVWAALAFCAPPSSIGSQNATGTGARNWSVVPQGGSGGVGGTGAGTLTSPTALLVLLVVVALVVVALAVLVTGGEDDDSEPADPVGPTDDVTQTIGSVAGAAADRIDADDGHAGNEVYRAWQEMTESLDVDSPETTTPREFQRAAVAAGMARDDVAALTSLFESVRYGGRAPTAETERRAVETLRRIESSYGGK